MLQVRIHNSEEENAVGQVMHVIHNGLLIAEHADDMDPSDCFFHRDLDWIAPLLMEVYHAGRFDAQQFEIQRPGQIYEGEYTVLEDEDDGC